MNIKPKVQESQQCHLYTQQIYGELGQVTQSPTLEQTPTTLPYIILDARLQKGVAS